MVGINRSTRTPLDSERPKLSASICCEALSQSGARGSLSNEHARCYDFHPSPHGPADRS